MSDKAETRAAICLWTFGLARFSSAALYFAGKTWAKISIFSESDRFINVLLLLHLAFLLNNDTVYNIDQCSINKSKNG